MTERPVDVHLAYNDTQVSFHAAATSDDSTPFTLIWYQVFEDGGEMPINNNTDRRVMVSGDSTVLSFSVPENMTNAWSRLKGTYRVRATNSYSEDIADVRLTVDNDPGVIVVPSGECVENLSVSRDVCNYQNYDVQDNYLVVARCSV